MEQPTATTPMRIWKWNGAQWSVIDSSGPPVRSLGGVAYDSDRGVVVMYGGSYSLDLTYDETWEWSVSSGWTKRSVAGPGKRDHTDMVYDKTRHRMVLHGGQQSLQSFPSSTWTWDGTAWQEHAAAGPGSRIHHTMLWDPVGQRVLLFGGSRPPSGGDAGDTWAWNGSSWASAAAAITPRTHARLGLTVDDVILLGGFQAQSATVLALDDGAWSAMPGMGPGARYLTAMAFDAARGVTVLYGGGDPASDRLYSDTWEFSPGMGWRRVS